MLPACQGSHSLGPAPMRSLLEDHGGAVRSSEQAPTHVPERRPLFSPPHLEPAHVTVLIEDMEKIETAEMCPPPSPIKSQQELSAGRATTPALPGTYHACPTGNIVTGRITSSESKTDTLKPVCLGTRSCPGHLGGGWSADPRCDREFLLGSVCANLRGQGKATHWSIST